MSACPRCGVELFDGDYEGPLGSPAHTDARCAERLKEQRDTFAEGSRGCARDARTQQLRAEAAEARVAELSAKLEDIGHEYFELESSAAATRAKLERAELLARQRGERIEAMTREIAHWAAYCGTDESLRHSISGAHKQYSALAALDATEEK